MRATITPMMIPAISTLLVDELGLSSDVSLELYVSICATSRISGSAAQTSRRRTIQSDECIGKNACPAHRCISLE